MSGGFGVLCAAEPPKGLAQHPLGSHVAYIPHIHTELQTAPPCPEEPRFMALATFPDLHRKAGIVFCKGRFNAQLGPCPQPGHQGAGGCPWSTGNAWVPSPLQNVTGSAQNPDQGPQAKFKALGVKNSRSPRSLLLGKLSRMVKTGHIDGAWHWLNSSGLSYLARCPVYFVARLGPVPTRGAGNGGWGGGQDPGNLFAARLSSMTGLGLDASFIKNIGCGACGAYRGHPRHCPRPISSTENARGRVALFRPAKASQPLGTLMRHPLRRRS